MTNPTYTNDYLEWKDREASADRPRSFYQPFATDDETNTAELLGLVAKIERSNREAETRKDAA